MADSPYAHVYLRFLGPTHPHNLEVLSDHDTQRPDEFEDAVEEVIDDYGGAGGGGMTAAQQAELTAATNHVNSTVPHMSTAEKALLHKPVAFSPAAMTAGYSIDANQIISVPPGTSGGLAREVLVIATLNTINDLAAIPSGGVEFSVNGVQTSGITNSGKSVTVDPATVGYDIVPGVDVVTAVYAV